MNHKRYFGDQVGPLEFNTFKHLEYNRIQTTLLIIKKDQNLKNLWINFDY